MIFYYYYWRFHFHRDGIQGFKFMGTLLRYNFTPHSFSFFLFLHSSSWSWVWKNQIWFAWHQRPSKIHQATFARNCCPLPCHPLNVSEPQVLHVAVPGAEEVAGVVVRVGGLTLVVAVVTTSVISIAGAQTVLVAGYRDQEVGGNTTTPKILRNLG